jgi:hypothetical protein
MSTLHRWQDQVRECTPQCTCHCYFLTQFLQISLIMQCTLKMQLNDDVFIIYENVPSNSDHHMKEDITRVHIVHLTGFLWKDDADNVVPTCTCPSNRNLKDCCAGIMFALQRRQEFSAWFAKGFIHHPELLNRRLRADCDPVSVHFVMLSNQFATNVSFCHSVQKLQ